MKKDTIKNKKKGEKGRMKDEEERGKIKAKIVR